MHPNENIVAQLFFIVCCEVQCNYTNNYELIPPEIEYCNLEFLL